MLRPARRLPLEGKPSGVLKRQQLPPDLGPEFQAEFDSQGRLTRLCHGQGRGWSLEIPSAERAQAVRATRVEWSAEEESLEEFCLRWVATIQKQGGFPRECSFCGKDQSQVARLIAGPEVMICNECVELCSEILGEAEAG